MIEARGLSKRWGGVVALDDVSIKIEAGELVALLGPSGSGKTTLLRVLAGLEAADRGETLIDGRPAGDRSVRERGMGFVFQQHALFRHMSVYENVAFGLRVLPRRERPSEAVVRDKVARLLRLVQLEGLEARLPGQLSGGQCQRVAFARALAVEPRVLLLDEPFASLDAQVKKELRAWLRSLHEELHVTSVFVTHDQEEALELADRVVVLRGGRVEQVGSPEDVVDRPETAFVHEFLGDVNALEGTVRGGRVDLGAGLAFGCSEHAEGARVRVLVRAYDLELAPGGDAVVRRVLAFADRAKLELELPGGARVSAHLSRRDAGADLAVGARASLRVVAARVYSADAAERGGAPGTTSAAPPAVQAAARLDPSSC